MMLFLLDYPVEICLLLATLFLFRHYYYSNEKLSDSLNGTSGHSIEERSINSNVVNASNDHSAGDPSDCATQLNLVNQVSLEKVGQCETVENQHFKVGQVMKDEECLTTPRTEGGRRLLARQKRRLTLNSPRNQQKIFNTVNQLDNSVTVNMDGNSKNHGSEQESVVDQEQEPVVVAPSEEQKQETSSSSMTEEDRSVKLWSNISMEIQQYFQRRMIHNFVQECVENVDQMERLSQLNDSTAATLDQEFTNSISCEDSQELIHDFVNQCIESVQLFQDMVHIVSFVDRCIMNVIVKQNLVKFIECETESFDTETDEEKEEEAGTDYSSLQVNSQTMSRSGSFRNRLFSCAYGQITSPIPLTPQMDDEFESLEEMVKSKKFWEQCSFEEGFDNEDLPYVYGALGKKKKGALGRMRSFVSKTRATLDNYTWIGL